MNRLHDSKAHILHYKRICKFTAFTPEYPTEKPKEITLKKSMEHWYFLGLHHFLNSKSLLLLEQSSKVFPNSRRTFPNCKSVFLKRILMSIFASILLIYEAQMTSSNCPIYVLLMENAYYVTMFHILKKCIFSYRNITIL